MAFGSQQNRTTREKRKEKDLSFVGMPENIRDDQPRRDNLLYVACTSKFSKLTQSTIELIIQHLSKRKGDGMFMNF